MSERSSDEYDDVDNPMSQDDSPLQAEEESKQVKPTQKNPLEESFKATFNGELFLENELEASEDAAPPQKRKHRSYKERVADWTGNQSTSDRKRDYKEKKEEKTPHKRNTQVRQKQI